MAISVTVDGHPVTLNAPGEMPLLWALRDLAGITGVKFGCGAGLCGACSVLVDGERLFGCQTALADVAGKHVTTIAGLVEQPLGRVLAQAWDALDVVQCGYCQPGQLVAAAALLTANAKPDDAAIDAGMSGNLCRCGTYNRIRAAIHHSAELLAGASA